MHIKMIWYDVCYNLFHFKNTLMKKVLRNLLVEESKNPSEFTIHNIETKKGQGSTGSLIAG